MLYIYSSRLAGEVENALKLSDQDCFLGHATHLGRNIFLTVEHDQCSVNIRHWFALKQNQGDPEAELIAGREGIKLGYDQFRKLRVFLEKHIDDYLPNFKDHVFRCNKADHVPAECPLCFVCGRLPLERKIQRLLGKFNCFLDKFLQLVCIEIVMYKIPSRTKFTVSLQFVLYIVNHK